MQNQPETSLNATQPVRAEAPITQEGLLEAQRRYIMGAEPSVNFGSLTSQERSFLTVYQRVAGEGRLRLRSIEMPRHEIRELAEPEPVIQANTKAWRDLAWTVNENTAVAVPKPVASEFDVYSHLEDAAWARRAPAAPMQVQARVGFR